LLHVSWFMMSLFSHSYIFSHLLLKLVCHVKLVTLYGKHEKWRTSKFGTRKKIG